MIMIAESPYLLFTLGTIYSPLSASSSCVGTPSCLMVWVMDGSYLSISCQKRQALQSKRYFSSQDTMRPIQTTLFPDIINHIIMELRLFAKHLLLLMIICTTAAPRGRDALCKVHRKKYACLKFSFRFSYNLARPDTQRLGESCRKH